MTNEKLDELYSKIAGNNTYPEIEKAINEIKDENIAKELRARWCNEVLDLISFGYMRYDPKTLSKNDLVPLYIKESHLIKDDKPIFEAVAQFYLNNYESCWQYIASVLPDDKSYQINENDFVSFFFQPFKNAYPGFWSKLAGLLKTKQVQAGIVELCNMSRGILFGSIGKRMY